MSGAPTADLPARPAARLLAATGQGAGLGCATGAVVAVIDTLAALLGRFDGTPLGFAAYALSSLVFACGVLGALLGTWTALVLAIMRRLDPSGTRGAVGLATPRALLLGLPAGAFVAWVPTSWITEHWESLSPRSTVIAVAVYPAAWLGCAAIAGLAHAVVQRYARSPSTLPRLHPALLALAALLAAASYWADRTVLVDLYDDFHYGLTGLFVSAIALLWVLLLRTPAIRALAPLAAARRHASRLRLSSLVLALGTLVLLEALQPDVFGPSQSLVFTKLVGTVRTWTDFDGDGPSHLFGGSDCAPFDPEVTPGKFDIPGDARDEDCSGTAAQWPRAETTTSYPIPDAAGFNLLLITVDALRADHIGAWGYTRHPTTPNIDRLAAQSLRFARAFSPAPKTYDAMPSLLTGLYPSNVPRNYRVEVPPEDTHKRPYLYRITDEVDLLTEILQQKGYVTGAGHGVSLLDYLDLDRGFDEHQTTTEQTVFALDFLQRRVVDAAEKKPFFVWLHYYSPHYPYKRHEEFPFGDEDIDRYDAEIAYDDKRIGTLLTGMEERGLLDRTVVVLTADHGEEFREHGGTEHGFKLYSELTHVPLLVKIPGVAPAVVDDPVELADVAPTLCEALQLGDACDEHDGHSLFEALAGKRDPARGAYSEMYRKNDVMLMTSLYTDQWRVIFDYKKDRAELYDVKRDPREQTNLANVHPELVKAFRDQLATRTLYKQGRVFQRYRETGESLVLAEGLPVFRRRELLRVVLREIERDLEPRHATHLKKLRKRPGLDAKTKKRVDGLIGRANALAKRRRH